MVVTKVWEVKSNIMPLKFSGYSVLGSNPAFSRWNNWSPFDSISLLCCQFITINTNKLVYRQSQGWSHISSGVEWAECSLIIGTGYWVHRFSCLAWSSIARSVCQRTFILLEIRFQTPWEWILHSTEEDNWSPFDSISLPYSQFIKINTEKHMVFCP